MGLSRFDTILGLQYFWIFWS